MSSTLGTYWDTEWRLNNAKEMLDTAGDTAYRVCFGAQKLLASMAQ
jgi:hypothetical protein